MNNFFTGVVFSAIVVSIAWYFSVDMGINVPWSNKRIYTYEYCPHKFQEHQYEVCELKPEIKKQLIDRQEKIHMEECAKEDGWRPSWYSCEDDLSPFVDSEFWDSVEPNDYICQKVWLGSGDDKSWLSTYLKNKRCTKPEVRQTKVTIDKDAQVVWFHNGDGLKKEQCKVLDHDNYDCGYFNVVNGKPIDTEVRIYK